jgi:hypothetical protein
MAEELNLDEIKNAEEKKDNVGERIQNLVADKKQAEEAKAKAEEAKAVLEKERDFYASFSDSTSKYPEASQFKDVIKEKVMAGYTVEDATVSVLAREGKFTQHETEKEIVAGGSSANLPNKGSSKPVSEMSREEKHQALVDAESRGDITFS